MASVIATGGFSGSELLSGGGLGLRVEIFNLGFTEDDPGVAGWGAVDVRVRDDEENSFRSSQGDSCDAWNVLQAQLANGLSCLLLVSAVDCDGRPSWDSGLAFSGSVRDRKRDRYTLVSNVARMDFVSPC